MKDGTQQLPESARLALLKIADVLRGGFTGRIEIECTQGGVGSVQETRRWRPSDERQS